MSATGNDSIMPDRAWKYETGVVSNIKVVENYSFSLINAVGGTYISFEFTQQPGDYAVNIYSLTETDESRGVPTFISGTLTEDIIALLAHQDDKRILQLHLDDQHFTMIAEYDGEVLDVAI